VDIFQTYNICNGSKHNEFSREDRTYYISDERLCAFRQLTLEQKLSWVEELASFLRMAKNQQGKAAGNFEAS
jgi:hypothetical protein